MLPICSFSLKAKIPSLIGLLSDPKTLGDYIKKERIFRKLNQTELTKLLNVPSSYVSFWEKNIKPCHPKFVEGIIDFLGFIPTLKSKFDKLGTRTKLWRLKHSISLNEFCEMVGIEQEAIMKIENNRHYVIDVRAKKKIDKFISRKPTSFSSLHLK